MSTKGNAPSIAADVLHAIVERLRAGTTALIAESKTLGFTHNGPLRGALRTLLGTDGYDELMKAKRPIGGPARVRGEGGTRVVVPPIDDSAVARIKSTEIRYVDSPTVVAMAHADLAALQERTPKGPSEAIAIADGVERCTAIIEREAQNATYEGWRSTRVPGALGHHVRLTAPDGTAYLPARSAERADIIVVSDVGEARYKLEAMSSLARKERHEAKLVAKGEEAARVRREQRQIAPAMTESFPKVVPLTKAEKRAEAFRAKAEAAFYGLSQEERDAERANPAWDSYEGWYRGYLKRGGKPSPETVKVLNQEEAKRRAAKPAAKAAPKSKAKAPAKKPAAKKSAAKKGGKRRA